MWIVRRLHLWAGVLLGAQVLLWMLSGVVMSWFHLDLVRGDREAAHTDPIALNGEVVFPAERILAAADPVYEIELKRFLGAPVWETRGAGAAAIYDGLTGELLSPIQEEQARAVARAAYSGAAEIVGIGLVVDPGSEMRDIGPRPIWRAQFDDRFHTRIYVSPQTGEVLRRRNDIWRVYDFFWMLHIMDFQERSDSNNWLLRWFSLGGLLFAASGLVMIFFRSSRNLIASDVGAVLRIARGGK